jgi:peptidoglycan/LPS O-acetylase OafA/YrhL
VNSSPNTQVASRIPELDGLRGLAILMVVFYHYGFCSGLPVLGGKVFSLTWSGVDLFFVLSGFLIGGILLDQRQTENYFKAFYIRRVCRIIPLYYLWLALFFLLPWLLPTLHHQKWFAAIFIQDIPRWCYTFFLQNIYSARTEALTSHWLEVTWSLAVEEQFYLLLPLVIWLVPVKRLPPVLVTVILCAPLFRLYLYVYDIHASAATYQLLPCRADALLMGVGCAYGVRQERLRHCLRNNQGRLRVVLAVLLAGVGYLTIYGNKGNGFDLVFWGYSWLALFYACLLLVVITSKQGMIVSVMRLPPLRYLGAIAYGVYMMHMAIISLMHGLILGNESHITNLADGSVTVAALVATLFFAALSWHFFEKPIIRWGHSFSYTHPNPQPPE